MHKKKSREYLTHSHNSFIFPVSFDYMSVIHNFSLLMQNKQHDILFIYIFFSHIFPFPLPNFTCHETRSSRTCNNRTHDVISHLPTYLSMILLSSVYFFFVRLTHKQTHTHTISRKVDTSQTFSSFHVL